MNTTQATATGERADLLASLGERRYFHRLLCAAHRLLCATLARDRR